MRTVPSSVSLPFTRAPGTSPQYLLSRQCHHIQGTIHEAPAEDLRFALTHDDVAGPVVGCHVLQGHTQLSSTRQPEQPPEVAHGSLPGWEQTLLAASPHSAWGQLKPHAALGLPIPGSSLGCACAATSPGGTRGCRWSSPHSRPAAGPPSPSPGQGTTHGSAFTG